jgi:hypothetical protein
MAAFLTRIRWALGVAMMLGDLFALRAVHAIGIEPFDQLLKTSCIVWILALEVHQGIGAIGCARPDRLIAIDLAHTVNHGIAAHLRQGDSNPFLDRRATQNPDSEGEREESKRN